MKKLMITWFLTFIAAPLAFAQKPPTPPPDDFPKPAAPEGKKESKPNKNRKDLIDPERNKGVKPPMPVTPPTPEPTEPDEP